MVCINKGRERKRDSKGWTSHISLVLLHGVQTIGLDDKEDQNGENKIELGESECNHQQSRT